jgi:MoaA/NifB/PqqE/SkfB family radical SAM enzyme
MRLFSHPILCNYYLTYRCNAKCGFCDIWEKPSPYVTDEHMAANLRDLKRLGVRVIDFTGGEPLLHRGLPQFLAQAKQLGFITTVTTNTLLYPKYAEALRGKIDMLHFSLDYPDRARHNASRGVDCYDHLLRSIDIAKTLGERPDILYTVTNDSFADIAQVYEDFSVRHNLLLILNPVFEYNEVGSSLSVATFKELRQWARKKNVYLNTAFLDLRERGGNQTDKPVCVAGSSTIVISPENQLILPCYHLGANAIPLNGDLYDVWTHPHTQALVRQEGRLPGCQGCTINCYMQPSFAYQLNSYFLRALPSTAKYALEKWVLA